MDIAVNILGWVAMAAAALSFAQTGELHIRIVNLAAAVLYLVYALLISAQALAAYNMILCVVQTVMLIRMQTDVDARAGVLFSDTRLTPVVRKRLSWAGFWAMVIGLYVVTLMSTGFDYMEIIGLVASTLCLSGFGMHGEKSIRILSMSGCAVYIIYSIGIASIPMIAANILFVGIHAYKLWRLGFRRAPNA